MAKQSVTTVELRNEAIKGGKVPEIAKNVFEKLRKDGYTHNSAGKAISKENLARLLRAMCNDITNEKRGWWSTYKVEEDEKAATIKFVKRQVL